MVATLISLSLSQLSDTRMMNESGMSLCCPWSMFVLEDKIVVLGPDIEAQVLGLEAQVFGPGLDVLRRP